MLQSRAFVGRRNELRFSVLLHGGLIASFRFPNAALRLPVDLHLRASAALTLIVVRQRDAFFVR
jgi:hypothetical protein